MKIGEEKMSMMTCLYCLKFSKYETNYITREAIYDLYTAHPRCAWHWRFVCDFCGKAHHFNGITWCSVCSKYVCRICGSYIHKNHSFYGWDYYIEIQCPQCGGQYPALDFLEFDKKHPWQTVQGAQVKKAGLSTGTNCNTSYFETKNPVTYLPIDQIKISDEEISLAWDKAASKWLKKSDKFGDPPREFLINPAIFKILGNIENKKTLDAGCGNGYFCELLAIRRAQVTGIDISKEFIKLARKNTSSLITYKVGNICKMDMFKDNTFDTVVSINTLMDVLDFEQAISEIQRVLRPGGILALSITHPCFSSPKVSGWVRKPIDSCRHEDSLYWHVDYYFDRVAESRDYDIMTIHRPLSDYVQCLIDKGFAVTHFIEPQISEATIKKNARWSWRTHKRVCLLLVIGARLIT